MIQSSGTNWVCWFPHRILENTKVFLCFRFFWVSALQWTWLGLRRWTTSRNVTTHGQETWIQIQAWGKHQNIEKHQLFSTWNPVSKSLETTGPWSSQSMKQPPESATNVDIPRFWQISGCFIRELLQLCGGNLSMEWSMWGAMGVQRTSNNICSVWCGQQNFNETIFLMSRVVFSKSKDHLNVDQLGHKLFVSRACSADCHDRNVLKARDVPGPMPCFWSRATSRHQRLEL